MNIVNSFSCFLLGYLKKGPKFHLNLTAKSSELERLQTLNFLSVFIRIGDKNEPIRGQKIKHILS